MDKLLKQLSILVLLGILIAIGVIFIDDYLVAPPRTSYNILDYSNFTFISLKEANDSVRSFLNDTSINITVYDMPSVARNYFYYELNVNGSSYGVNAESGIVELLYINRPASGLVNVSFDEAKLIAEKYAVAKFPNFTDKNMSLDYAALNNNIKSYEYVFGWSETLKGVKTGNRLHISIDAYNGAIVSYEGKHRSVTVSLDPVITKKQAVRIASREIPYFLITDVEVDPYLLYVNKSFQRLAWHVQSKRTTYGPGDKGGTVLLDATDGTVYWVWLYEEKPIA